MNMVDLRFCCGVWQKIQFEVNPEKPGDLSKLWKFGKEKEEWPEACFTDWEYHQSKWATDLQGLKALVNFFSGLFYVKSVEFHTNVSLELMNHIIQNRKLKIDKLHWSKGNTAAELAEKVFEIALNVPNFEFTGEQNGYTFDRFREFSHDNLEINPAHWMTRANLFDLINCSRAVFENSQLTSLDLNAFLKHCIANKGRINRWEISTKKKIDMNVVMKGVKCQVRSVKKKKSYIIQNPDGVRIKVEFEKAYNHALDERADCLELTVME